MRLSFVLWNYLSFQVGFILHSVSWKMGNKIVTNGWGLRHCARFFITSCCLIQKYNFLCLEIFFPLIYIAFSSKVFCVQTLFAVGDVSLYTVDHEEIGKNILWSRKRENINLDQFIFSPPSQSLNLTLSKCSCFVVGFQSPFHSLSLSLSFSNYS